MGDITNVDQLSIATPLHWDTTNSRLGIGTETPQAALDATTVNGLTVKLSASGYQFNTTVNTLEVYNASADSFGEHGNAIYATSANSGHTDGNGYALKTDNDIRVNGDTYLNGDTVVGVTQQSNLTVNGRAGVGLLFSDSVFQVHDGSVPTYARKIAVNVGNTDATEIIAPYTRQGLFSRVNKPVYTREDHGYLDASGFLPIAGNFTAKMGPNFDDNYNGFGYVMISNGRNHDSIDFVDINSSIEFNFDTFNSFSGQNVFFKSTGFPGDIFSNQDVDGSFCITVPSNSSIYSNRALTLINNTPYQFDVFYSVKYSQNLDPYTYLGWLYD